MKAFEENDRYVYSLTADSVVLDCGGYRGDFAAEINRRYGCRVFVLEPVEAFREQCLRRFSGNAGVSVHPFGISGESRWTEFSVRNDSTGEFALGCERELVLLKSPRCILEHFDLKDVALLKLNIEGAEFEVLENILSDGLVSRFADIQVQWHPVVCEAEARRNAIIRELSKTHHLTFDSEWIWQNWRRNDAV